MEGIPTEIPSNYYILFDLEIEVLTWSVEYAVEVIAATNNEVIEVTLTSTCRDEVTADNLVVGSRDDFNRVFNAPRKNLDF